jgi:hypothetical protein
MQARSSASMTKSLRNLGRVFAIAGLTAIVSGCAQTGDVRLLSDHPPVSITILAAGSPPPPTWTCKTTGRYMMCVSEEPINLENDTSPVKITWVIAASAGWTFTSDPRGIQVNQGQWNETGVTATEYSATSTRKDGMLYKYNISVTNGTDPHPLRWDPTIWN